jgi:hypothetical protein
MTELKKALVEWQFFYPPNGNCCNGAHTYGNLRPKPDEHVCERENAWRRYVRLRDGDPEFPFKKELRIVCNNVPLSRHSIN